MPVLTIDEFKEWMTEVVGTCTYGPCGKPIHNDDHYTKREDGLYHEDCFRQKADDELSAEIDEHPIISHGVKRHTLVDAMGNLD
ncbi:MAG: hypothetical protein WCI72_01150 [archaeon]